MSLGPERYLASTRTDGATLLAAAEGAMGAPVPSCPDWNGGDLVWHIGGVHRFWATIAEKGSLAFEGVEPATRPEAEELVAWSREQLERLVRVLAGADPSTPVWTWADRHDMGFIQRRMAQETAVHRWDAELAAAGLEGATAIDPELAVDGVDEFLEHFMIVDVAKGAAPQSLHLHATDTDGEWLVRFGGGEFGWERAHGKGDAAVRATASDLLLALWGRIFVGDARLEVFGDEGGLAALRSVSM